MNSRFAYFLHQNSAISIERDVYCYKILAQQTDSVCVMYVCTYLIQLSENSWRIIGRSERRHLVVFFSSSLFISCPFSIQLMRSQTIYAMHTELHIVENAYARTHSHHHRHPHRAISLAYTTRFYDDQFEYIFTHLSLLFAVVIAAVTAAHMQHYLHQNHTLKCVCLTNCGTMTECVSALNTLKWLKIETFSNFPTEKLSLSRFLRGGDPSSCKYFSIVFLLQSGNFQCVRLCTHLILASLNITVL